MQLPDGQLERITNTLRGLLADCAARAAADDEQSRLSAAIEQLLEVMARLEADASAGSPAEPAAITEIGEYALHLTDSLAGAAGRLGLTDSRPAVAGLYVDIALWIARHNGVIDTLEPVVDAIALLANSTRDPGKLEAFSEALSNIVAAVSPLIREDLEKANPGRPWRVLLLNQGIIATRSYNTALMERAFAQLTRALPEEAGRFFSEGMQQMDALDYPEHVRQVMQKYHRQWNRDRALH